MKMRYTFINKKTKELKKVTLDDNKKLEEKELKDFTKLVSDPEYAFYAMEEL